MPLALRTAVCVLMLCAASFAAGFSFTGNFINDNDLQFFNVNMAADGNLTIQTFGYAGGLNQAGNNISAGGFAPALSVFDSSGNLIANDNLGGTVPFCNGRGVDPVTGFCFDAIVYDSASQPLFLFAGNYTVVLSQQGNISFGSLAAGFTYDAANFNDPAFTGNIYGQPGKKFVDPFGIDLRTSAWAVDFVSDQLRSVGEVPEPGTISLLLLGAAGLASARFSRRFR